MGKNFNFRHIAPCCDNCSYLYIKDILKTELLEGMFGIAREYVYFCQKLNKNADWEFDKHVCDAYVDTRTTYSERLTEDFRLKKLGRI